MHKRLQALEVKQPAFSNPPRGYEAKGAHWIKPDLVAEIEFTEWTNDGTLRHPSFQGLREDKKATDVVREKPTPTEEAIKEPAPEQEKAAAPKKRARKSEVQAPSSKKTAANDKTAKTQTASDDANIVAGIKLSNPTKLLYPEAGITKRDLAVFYESISDWILPHLRNRPLTLVRCPNGWEKTCFFQKHPDEKVDSALERVTVQESNGPTLYMMANTVSALVALVQMGALELHPFGSSAPKLQCPDRIIFDFDPDDSVSWDTLVESVHLLKTLLEELGLKTFIKTTGGKGLHVVVPIRPSFGWDEIKNFTKAIAELLVKSFPERFVAVMTKSKRTGKIFVDYLRNADGATAVSAYSLRARAHAPVATPISWDELEHDIRRDYFNAKNIPQRLKTLEKDPWSGFFDLDQAVTKAMLKKVGLG
jgi:bifunctional non-homologous end joining protein LigD